MGDWEQNGGRFANSRLSKKPPARPVYDYEKPNAQQNKQKRPQRMVYDYTKSEVHQPPVERGACNPAPVKQNPHNHAPVKREPEFVFPTGQYRPHMQQEMPQRNEHTAHPQAAKKTKKRKKATNAAVRGAQQKSSRRRAPKQKKIKPPISYGDARRRRMWRKIGAVFGVLIALAIGVLLSMNALFKIDTIEFEGETAYTQEELLGAFGHKKGESMFAFGAQTAAQMENRLPYLENIAIKRRLPNTVKISFVTAQERYAVNSAAGWVVVSSGFKVLRLSGEAPEGLVLLQGVEAENPTAGQALAFTEPDKLSALTALSEQLGAQEISPVGSVDLTDVLNISFLYDGRIRVAVGTVNELSVKLEWAKYLLTPENEQSLSTGERGTLDVSSRNKDGRIEGVWRAGAL